jgi:hypothetical protein
MMKCWEAEGERGDDTAKLHATRRIRTMCVNMAKQQAAYVSNRQPAGTATNYGYLRESLLPSIPFDRIILDVLHCFLRVYDVLFSLLVEDSCRVGTTCLARLQAEVSGNCGVTRFEFSYGDYDADKERRKADPDSRPSRAVTFTELDGNEKLRVLRNIKIEIVFDTREGVDVEVRQNLEGI